MLLACTAALGALNWTSGTIDGMDYQSVTNGTSHKTVVWLHGGGGTGGGEVKWNFDSGWWGDISGLKIVFPTSPRSDHLWFRTYKNGCGEDQDCSYYLEDIHASAEAIGALVEHERQLLGGEGSKVFLGGFSQGAEMTNYMQLAHLDFALGGVVAMDGYPIPPLVDWATRTSRVNATYRGLDMRWMIWHGSADIYFNANTTLALYHDIFDLLGVRSALKFEYVKPGMPHTEVPEAFGAMVKFVRGQPIPTPSPSPPSPPSPTPGKKGCVADPTCSFKVSTSLPGCKVCAHDKALPWSCGECCPSCTPKKIAGGTYCSCPK